jgi:hypothetical protein
MEEAPPRHGAGRRLGAHDPVGGRNDRLGRGAELGALGDALLEGLDAGGVEEQARVSARSLAQVLTQLSGELVLLAGLGDLRRFVLPGSCPARSRGESRQRKERQRGRTGQEDSLRHDLRPDIVPERPIRTLEA